MISDNEARPGWAGVAITLAGVAIAALIVLAVPDLRDAVSAAIRGDTEELRSEVDSLGATGTLIVFALGLIHTVVFYPAEILDTAAGFAYGFWPGLALVMAAWLTSALIAYWIGAHAARPILYKLIGEDRFRRGERLVERGGLTFLLGIRLMPIVPFSAVCYVCGAAGVPLGRYMWTTAVGYLPITAVFVYLGTQLEELSPTDPLLLIGAAVVALLVASTVWLGPKILRTDTRPARAPTRRLERGEDRRRVEVDPAAGGDAFGNRPDVGEVDLELARRLSFPRPRKRPSTTISSSASMKSSGSAHSPSTWSSNTDAIARTPSWPWWDPPQGSVSGITHSKSWATSSASSSTSQRESAS